MDFHQNTVSGADNDNQKNTDNIPNGNNQYDLPVEDTAQSMNSASGQEQVQPPYGNSAQSQYQVQQPYGNEGRSPYQNGNQYNNNNGNPYYGNTAQGTNPSYNNNGYGNRNYNNNSYGNGGYNNNYNNYTNNNYNYGRYAYPVNVSEPGSKLSTAAMVLGIISIITFFTFTVYPAFITGSIAIVLAILSKGRRPKLLNNARIGIICAVIGLVLNVMVITGTIVRYNTDEGFREEVNRTFEELYGQSLDEMIEEILEDSGYTD